MLLQLRELMCAHFTVPAVQPRFSKQCAPVGAADPGCQWDPNLGSSAYDFGCYIAAQVSTIDATLPYIMAYSLKLRDGPMTSTWFRTLSLLGTDPAMQPPRWFMDEATVA
eukprot:6489022-Prymnesium_polylepis.1